jgi:HKD family nuclease
MKLITDRAALGQALTKCIEDHQNISFAVAWATGGTKVYETLKARRKSIRSGVIGTHFYQTAPEVLEDFVDDGAVRFVLQPSGVFHPKVFLFRTGRRWDAFVGSANLTKGALSRNSEAMLHVSDADPDATAVRDDLDEAIRRYRSIGKKATAEDAEIYRASHERMRTARERLSGRYGSTASTSPLDSAVMRMSWGQYLSAVREPGKEDLTNRITLLNAVRAAFSDGLKFADMDVDTRAMIAGLPNELTKNQGYFGSMKGDGYFHTAVKKAPDGISAAMDRIPLTGPVTRDHYDQFVELLDPAIEGERKRPGIASRLLAMKRPDLFVCISRRNKAGLAADFGIPASRIDYDLYWTGITGRIWDARWWSQKAPAGGRELAVWRGRAAMLDAIFYQPD